MSLHLHFLLMRAAAVAKTSLDRDYLVEKGVIKSNYQAKRDDLLNKVKKTYTDSAESVYDTWSDSYLVSFHHWCASGDHCF